MFLFSHANVAANVANCGYVLSRGNVRTGHVAHVCVCVHAHVISGLSIL